MIPPLTMFLSGLLIAILGLLVTMFITNSPSPFIVALFVFVLFVVIGLPKEEEEHVEA